ncbi:5'/3'-nucleotidase SurE [Intestinibacter sp.]|uniref:5'/3'-nucleotidase SurE n=1 Tax=Intestinibacter sp. TaxID=1965304 RepID=UPI002A7483BF|nr:5'/3'-nucleotidase SurE [Intestinibacter sp.]MDY2734689.1 5'/3'-nucleotidase SurE [Intestinibacter sp.]MDY4574891.1 5'/3'-nucleotidase SurE [Intestinibacter sp.]
MNIFITNDDGINAEGIKILAQEISKIANTYVVAPDSPRSASGHAITLHKPILINDEFIAENVDAYSTSGTPADCVKVGIEAILKDVEIDLVLSGINNGPNLGNDVLYSGTVAAAIEGLIERKPSIALSCNSSKVSTEEYEEAAKYTVALIQKLEGNLDKLDEIILNVNFPKGDKKGVKITKLGERVYNNVMDDRKSLRGQRYVWMGGDLADVPQDKDSDIVAVENGYVSITPVHIDMTNLSKMKTLKDLDIEDISL